MKKLLLTATAIVAFSSSAIAAGNTSTATATASATVVHPITVVTLLANLDFGNVYTGTTSNGLIAPAMVDVWGEPLRAFDLTIDDEVVLTHETDTSATLTADITTSTGATTSETLSVHGFFSAPVDANLPVPALAAPGKYNGSYTVTATYQ